MLQERARIARELHDSVSQMLYAITLGAVRARTRLEQNEGAEARHIIEDVLQLANDAQSELRAVMTDIRSNTRTSGGFIAALEHLALEVRSRNGLDVRLLLPDQPDVPEPTQDALVMITREALHNIIKHANASRAEIEVTFGAAQLVLSITDDGRGFDPAKPRPGHFGLESMRERATAVEGTFALASGVGRGTQVRVTIPARLDTDG